MGTENIEGSINEVDSRIQHHLKANISNVELYCDEFNIELSNIIQSLLELDILAETYAHESLAFLTTGSMEKYRVMPSTTDIVIAKHLIPLLGAGRVLAARRVMRATIKDRILLISYIYKAILSRCLQYHGPDHFGWSLIDSSTKHRETSDAFIEYAKHLRS